MSIHGGLHILEDISMVDTKTEEVPRTWRQRLWSWPWRPWVKTRIQVTHVPSSRVWLMGNTLVLHPETARRLKREIEMQVEQQYHLNARYGHRL